MMTTTSRMVPTIPVQLQLKTTMETIHHRTKAWIQKLHQQAGPQKTATTPLPTQQTQQVQQLKPKLDMYWYPTPRDYQKASKYMW